MNKKAPKAAKSETVKSSAATTKKAANPSASTKVSKGQSKSTAKTDPQLDVLLDYALKKKKRKGNQEVRKDDEEEDSKTDEDEDNDEGNAKKKTSKESNAEESNAEESNAKKSKSKGEKLNQDAQPPRELRPKKPATEEEIEGPKTKYFEGYDKYYQFPQPTGPSIYFNSAEFNKGGAQAVFSNFHGAGFYTGGFYFHSAEHFYQDEKALMIETDGGQRTAVNPPSGSRGPVLPTDLNAANLRLFLHSVSAASTHAAATRLFVMDGQLNEAWLERKPQALLNAVRHKFFRCPEERKYLLGTGSRELVEASPKDRDCGVGSLPEKAEENRAKWGKNMLGMALMHVRHELRKALARDESCFDGEDTKVGVHHLEFKKPSLAFQTGTFDVPGMPTCEQQHQQAIADIRKQIERETRDRLPPPEVDSNDKLPSPEVASNDKLPSTEVASNDKMPPPEVASNANVVAETSLGDVNETMKIVGGGDSPDLSPAEEAQCIESLQNYLWEKYGLPPYL